MQTFALEITDLPYEDILRGASDDPILRRQANLVLNDPYYSRLYKTMCASVSNQEAIKTLIAAGCFDDLLEERIQYPVHFISAPYPLVKRLHEEAKAEFPSVRQAVVISTGSYDPLHEGHMESVVRAKEFIEATGKSKVIAGFMSPSHDAYVRQKNPGGIVDFQRVHENTVYVENASYNQPQQWIFHENWEALGINVAINFTDVAIYIDGMLKAHVGNDIDVYYVFGGDNAAFGLTFTHNDDSMVKGICVGRPGYAIDPFVTKAIEESSTLFYTEGFNGMSSTQIRALREAQAVVEEPDDLSLPFILRNDTALSTAWVEEFVGKEELTRRQDAFTATLKAEFANIFADVRLIDVAEQLAETKEFVKTHFEGYNILSCDIYFEGDKKLRASRLFDVASSQAHGKNSHYANPEILDKPDENMYIFVDDDIVSGFFLSEVKKKFVITDAVSMADISIKEEYLDIADTRDFLVGAMHGGLMMDADVPFRAPYLAPFVDMIARLSMPGPAIRDFNIAVWEANVEFYRGTGITVADLPAEQSVFLKNMGFKDHEEITDICTLYKEIFL